MPTRPAERQPRFDDLAQRPREPYPGVEHTEHGGAWLKTLPPSEQRSIAHALLALPLVIEVQTSTGLVGLVHADCPFDDWLRIQALDFAALVDTDPIVESCLWSIERYERGYTGKVRNIRAVIHGHLTLKAHAVLGNVHFIDTAGAHPGWSFTFLNLQTLRPMT